jgi:hypothetical protein
VGTEVHGWRLERKGKDTRRLSALAISRRARIEEKSWVGVSRGVVSCCIVWMGSRFSLHSTEYIVMGGEGRK